MTPFWQDEQVTVYAGDCLDVLRGMPDASVDAVVTDPPYGLSDHGPDVIERALLAWLTGDRDHVPDGRGFMGRDWDSFVPPPAVWDECYRVLKPGGHVLAFAGTRSHDLMAISIRLAGFQKRDSIAWLYGSGFPKSLDVGKAIDKAAGAERVPSGAPTSLACEFVRRGIPCEGHEGETATSQSGLTIHALPTAPATDDARTWQGWGTALKPAHEPIVVARKPLAGTVAANVLTHGTGALNVDACRVETSPANLAEMAGRSGPGHGGIYGGTIGNASPGTTWEPTTGRWPPNVVLDPDAAAELDRQSGTLHSQDPATRGNVRGGNFFGGDGSVVNPGGYGDSGGASRFFPVFRYEAKAPTSERPRVTQDGAAGNVLGYGQMRCSQCGGLQVDGRASRCLCPRPDFQPDPSKVGHVAHPTVKPLDLMRWLVRLVTPPSGTVLDPFAGSGTTGEACVLEHMRAILVEREPDYLPLIVARLSKPLAVGFDFGEIA